MRRALIALSLAAGSATPAAAQLKDVTDQFSYGRVRGRAGGHLEFVQPEGDFGRFVDNGFGISGWVGIGLDRKSQVIVGIEGGFVNYGRRTSTVPLSPTIPGLYVDVTTQNNIATVGIPLRVELTRGMLRPYVMGSVGLAYFWTETSARGTSSAGDFASSTNFSDITANWTGGGGLVLQVSHGRNPVFIDFGIRHVANGEVEYLNEDSIRDGGGGTTIITPIRSEANFTLWQVGVAVGLR
ncbi:MAG TPA: hypothetical protein VG940_13850 [Gemmatimonadales bacterium]|nr:hypothetical protein [Gemmatimonadales bacterium]